VKYHIFPEANFLTVVNGKSYVCALLAITLKHVQFCLKRRNSYINCVIFPYIMETLLKMNKCYNTIDASNYSQ